METHVWGHSVEEASSISSEALNWGLSNVSRNDRGEGRSSSPPPPPSNNRLHRDDPLVVGLSVRAGSLWTDDDDGCSGTAEKVEEEEGRPTPLPRRRFFLQL